jgi:predicted kinase
MYRKALQVTYGSKEVCGALIQRTSKIALERRMREKDGSREQEHGGRDLHTAFVQISNALLIRPK